MAKGPDTKELEKRIVKLERALRDSRQREKRLLISEQRWRSVLERLPNYLLILDLHGNILYTNDVLPGLTMDEVIAMNAFEFIPAAHQGKLRRAMENALSTGEPETYEIQTNEIPVVIQDENTGWWSNRIRAVEREGEVVEFLVIVSDISEKKEAEEALRAAHDVLEQRVKARTKDLEIKSTDLEETNTALKILLKRREEDKTELEEKVLFSVKEFIFPYVEKLKTTIQDPTQKTYLDIIGSNLNDIVSPMIQKFSTKFSNLTPKEVLVANLVMQGKRTKHIAELLSLSPNTVNCHRDSIRKKIGIKKKRVNLRSYLLTAK